MTCHIGKSFCLTRLFNFSCNLVVDLTFKYSNTLYLKAFSYLRHVLLWGLAVPVRRSMVALSQLKR